MDESTNMKIDAPTTRRVILRWMWGGGLVLLGGGAAHPLGGVTSGHPSRRPPLGESFVAYASRNSMVTPSRLLM